jgi:rod shape determining protein RodA
MFSNQKFISKLDKPSLLALLLVCTLGLIVLFSAGYDHHAAESSPGVSWFFRSRSFLKQLLYFGLGIGVMTVAAALPSRWYYRLAPAVYITGIMLLIAVALFGTVINGSRRWLDFGQVNLQPAEFMKLGVILAVARVLSRYPPPEGGYSFISLWRPAFVILLPMALIIKQPDLGTALSVGAVGGMMVLFAGVRWRVLLTLTLTALLAVVPLWYTLFDYQKNRLLNLFNAERDPKGTGYHIIQSKIAVGSGELFGKGILQGTQTQLEFLPEHSTDFIFSVLAEEWGFLGCTCVLIAYFLLLTALLRTALKMRDLFSVFTIVGIVSLLFFHTFVNIGMVVGILPVVGIPLPLFSYGGSAVLSTLLSIGILKSLAYRQGVDF